MNTAELRRAEHEVLAAVEEQRSIAHVALIDDLVRRGFPDDAVRVAIWDLVDRRLVQLSSGGRVTAPPATR